MAMVVKNNMTAVNTLNILNKNSSALSKSLQKVSSGMKINSAADDASGYAISERMRVQIRSLDQANQNTQNGSSMMKVAEGAVSSTVEILKTLKEKAVNAANDSNTDSDRQTIQKELDQSIDQINDNANVTFNGKYLVDGSKNTIGKATYTALSNQSLSEDTKATTKLTDLAARNGDSLEIHDTDKVTVSYVQGGKTYSTTFQVKDETTGEIATLGDIFKKIEDENANDTVFASADNESILKAKVNDGILSEADAKNVAKLKQDAQVAFNDANTDLTDALTTLDGDKTTAAAAVDAWNEAAADWAAATGDTGNAGKLITANTTGTSGDYFDSLANNEAYKSVAGASSNFMAVTVTNLGTAKSAATAVASDAAKTVQDVADAAIAKATGTVNDARIKAAIQAVADKEGATKDDIVNFVTNLEKYATAVRDAKANIDSDVKTIVTEKGQAATGATNYKAYQTAKVAYDTAKAANDEYTGPSILEGKTVGLASSNDVVTTASGQKAITITAKASGIEGQISGFNISISDSQGNVKKSANAALDAFEETVRAQNESKDNAISLQVGAKANQAIKVGLTDMRAEALGLQGADGTKLNISTQTKANAAINVLDNAIQKALDQQTTIGSVESRLEYTSSNLTTASENVQASESTIRDADMAKEMTAYTKNNVLLQAAQSMLAQANQSSSNVLSLLQ